MHPDQERPTYETEADRSRELEVVKFLMQAERWHSVDRTPKYYPCDWVVRLDERRYGLLEIKVRDREYDHYMIGLRKAATLLIYSEIAGYIPMLGVQWTDTKTVGLWNPLRREYMMPGIGGRRDRGDGQDVEPVVMVPTRFCRRLSYL